MVEKKNDEEYNSFRKGKLLKCVAQSLNDAEFYGFENDPERYFDLSEFLMVDGTNLRKLSFIYEEESISIPRY